MEQTLFDNWASTYENTIIKFQDNYPFAGYYKVIEELQRNIIKYNIDSILDIGVGTGFMLSKLLKVDTKYYGIDFSDKMLNIAKSKFDNSKLLKHDICEGVPNNLINQKFDCILSAYTLHHFDNKTKIDIIKSFLKISNKGLFIIADISFDSIEHMNDVKKGESTNWDEEEEPFYFISNAFLEVLNLNKLQANYIKISYCSGIYIIRH